MVNLPLLQLGWQGEDPFQVDAELIATGRTCIIGASGSGKSFTVGVICEELCKNQIPFALVDVEGEYSGLKEKYEAIWVGEDERCDLRWDNLNVEGLARQALDSPPLIVDLSETEDPRVKVDKLLSGLYKEVSRIRTPYLVIIEEADRFVPQAGDRVPIINEIARRGRKRGIGLMLCTQRPAAVDKNVLSQCGAQLIGKLVINNDLQAVTQFFPGKGLPKQLTSLSAGSFYALGGLSAVPICIKIRARETRHGGITPKLTQRIVKPSKEVLAKLQYLEPEREQLGLSPLIASDDVPSLVRKQKRFVFLGKQETVAEVQLVQRPLIEVGVRLRKGLLKKKYNTMFFVLDGVTGRIARLADGVSFKEGLERFLGLSSRESEILRALSPDDDSSLAEVSNKMGVSEDIIRKPIRSLEEKGLVRSSTVGRKRMFRRLVDMPKIGLSQRYLGLEKVKASADALIIKEDDIREAVKGLEDWYVENLRQFFYPMYRVELTLKGRGRVVWVDGRTGKTIDL